MPDDAASATDRPACDIDAERVVDMLIVGAGFSGLGMAIAEARAGRRDFLIVEQAEEVGGTWQANTYPGCACDVPSHLYSFSFAPNPAWTQAFSPQAEIRRYLAGCVERFDLRPHLHLKTQVTSARFDAHRGQWRVALSRGGPVWARNLVLGLGALSRPAVPHLPGLAGFDGACFHSARWDHSQSLVGRDVAVVGTGASAIQLVPELAKVARSLTVYQRTAPWVLPRSNQVYPDWRKSLYAKAPPLQRLHRAAQYTLHELRGLPFVVAPRLMAIARKQGLAHLQRQVSDPALRARLTPEYTPGCKRILLSNAYYPALSLPHVSVVSDGIAQVESGGIRAADGRLRPHDAIVLATGFRVTDVLTPLHIEGLNGADLNGRWAEGLEAHLGTQISDFPNLFMLLGPNTGLGHSSMVFMIEAQIAYAQRCMARARSRGAAWIDVAPQAQAEFNAALRQRQGRTVWASGCQSWYLDARGNNPTSWPGLTLEFWVRTRILPIRGQRFGPPQHTLAGARP
jgi:cation diffusion facilitator CzcD-associated flavoprotein CzcO